MFCSQSCVAVQVLVLKIVFVVLKVVVFEVLLVSSSFSCSLWWLVFSMVFYCLWFPTRKAQPTNQNKPTNVCQKLQHCFFTVSYVDFHIAILDPLCTSLFPNPKLASLPKHTKKVFHFFAPWLSLFKLHISKSIR